jgi:hypothetical protein
MKRIWVMLTISLTCLSVNAQRQLSPMRLLPENAVAVVDVHWNEIRSNLRLRNIVGRNDFENVAKQVGLAESDVREWVVFSDIKPETSRGLGIVISGNFTLARVVQFARSHSWKAEQIRRRTAFVNPSDNSYLLPIADGLLVTGTRHGVVDVEHVLSQRGSPLVERLPFRSIWRQVNLHSSPIKFLITIPQEYQLAAGVVFSVASKLLNMVSFGIVGTIMDQIGLVRAMGMTISAGKAGYPTELVAMMESETKAWITAGAVNLLKEAPSVIGMQARTDADRETLKAVQSLSANYVGELLLVKFVMPESALSARDHLQDRFSLTAPLAWNSRPRRISLY